MDNLKLIAEIKEFIESDPMCSIDISPLIERYTNGLDREEQQSIRYDIFKVLQALKDDMDIDYADGDASTCLLTTRQGVFPTNSLQIKSTLKYEKGKQIRNTPPPPQSVTYITTHGAHSPAVTNSSHTKIGSEDSENKQIAKEGVIISRKTLIWTIALGLLTILLSILIARHVI